MIKGSSSILGDFLVIENKSENPIKFLLLLSEMMLSAASIQWASAVQKCDW